MSTSQYPKGSEWRKWDLHIHSPATVLNNQFAGADDSDKWEQYITKLETLNNTAVLGVTDYFSINGYLRLTQSKEAGRLLNIALLLPNVELRILPVTGAAHPIDLHLIFSPSIVSKLDSLFFQNLEFPHSGNKYKCTGPDLIRLGRDFRRDQTLAEPTAYQEGVNQFKVTVDQLRDILKKNDELRKNCVIGVANSNQDGTSGIQDNNLKAVREDIYRFSDIIFSGNPNDVLYFLGEGVDRPEVICQRYRGLKPCIIGSDAHSLDKIGQPDLNRHTWIKADPTFEGLRQTLNEPKDRVYIGPVPTALTRIEAEPTRIMQEIRICKLPDAKTDECWFENITLPLNPELIAIIGNKGSGKSALADIIALSGKTSKHASFSFLGDKRFRDKNNKAKYFQSTLIWKDTPTEDWGSLADNPSPDSVERVKYIPQQYLEEICSEIGFDQKKAFYSELQQVIFSHVPEADRLNFSTLDELLEHRGKETNEAMGLLVGELIETNKKIIALEDRLSDKYKKNVESRLVEKKRELQAHDTTKPKEVVKPEESAATQQQFREVGAELETKRSALKDLETDIAKTREELLSLAHKASKAEKLVTRLQNLQRVTSTTLQDSKADFADLGLTASDILSVTINLEPVSTLAQQINEAQQQAKVKLDGKTVGSLEHRRLGLLTEITQLQTRLSAPQQEHQNYLEALKEWTLTAEKITGTEQQPETIKYFERLLSEIPTTEVALKGLYRLRTRKTLEVYKAKQRLRDYYKNYYGAVQNFLSRHELASTNQFKLTFNVSISQSGFTEDFLGKLNLQKARSFSGPDGAAKLKKLIQGTNFDSPLGVLRFIRNILSELKNGGAKQHELKDQLRNNATVEDLYHLIFSLRYLSPRYDLRWDSKSLEQLSPGERGNLLLIFFLLVDTDKRPLIIDQPEENLDNQTVFKTLVPCIKDAKRRRQIILVTHNPNLAVVCDAEQVIYSNIHKEQKNKVIYESGAIEHPGTNARVIDVLEGTRPAFDKRDDKYFEATR